MIKNFKAFRPGLFAPVLFLGAVSALALFLAQPAPAQEGVFAAPAKSSVLVKAETGSPMDIVRRTSTVQPIDNQNTHPSINLTPDKSEIIHLSEPVRSLIVGNPGHLNILMDSAKTLVLVPREPGATFFTALNNEGEIIMQRHVIVGAPEKKYIRIRRSCMNAGGGECSETSVYYCPGMCHQVGILSADQGQPAVSAASSGNSANVSMDPSAYMEQQSAQ